MNAAVCLTGPYLRLSGRAGVGQHQDVEHHYSICMVHLVTHDTALARQTLAAKSHPFESNTLHLLPFQHLRNLVATHPAAVGVKWSNHVWDPFFVGLPCQQLSASSLSLLKGMCTFPVCAPWVVYIKFGDCIVCLRDQRAVMGGTQTLRHHLLCHRSVIAQSATPITQTAAAACFID